MIQFYDCQLTKDNLAENEMDKWQELVKQFTTMQTEVNEYLESFSLSMQSDKQSASNEHKYLKDLHTMKKLSRQLTNIIGKYEIAQIMCFNQN